MAGNERLKKVLEGAMRLHSLDIDALISKPAWGAINFEAARPSLDMLKQLGGYLVSLPIEQLPDSPLAAIQSALEQSAPPLDLMMKFDLEVTPSPTKLRDQIVGQIRAAADQLLQATQGWIAFLALQKGDVRRNMEALQGALDRAGALVVEAKATADAGKAEVAGIVSAAREASASVGVATFTQDFAGQATKLEAEASKWLGATGVLAVLAVLVAIATYFAPLPWNASGAVVAQLLTSKLVVLAVLISATVWCGRLFRATKHQAAVCSHRANALKSFQAFVKATDDEDTRNAVLLETTRSIFAIAPSGYLPTVDSGSDGNMKLLEVFRSTGSAERAT